MRRFKEADEKQARLEVGAKRGPGRLEKEMEAQTALEEMKNTSKAVLGGDSISAERPGSKRQRVDDPHKTTRDTEAETRAPEHVSNQADEKPIEPIG